MKVVIEEEKTQKVGKKWASNAIQEIYMKTIDFIKSHEILSQNENREGYCLKFKVAFLFEPPQSKYHDYCCLEYSFPHPNDEIQQRKILHTLKWMI